MNSLEELNGYSLNQVEFNDFRETRVDFDRPTGTNQTITIFENQTHNIPLGLNIDDIINADQANVRYILDFRSITGQSFIFYNSLPQGVSVVENPTNLFTISGIASKSIWDQIAVPSVQLPFGFNGAATYTASITYLQTDLTPITRSWTVAASVTAVEYISDPDPLTYYVNTTVSLDTPRIIADSGDFDPIWTLKIIPSQPAVIGNITSVNGGTFNAQTKVFEIVGDKDAVNSALATVFVSYTKVDRNFNYRYELTNNLNSLLEVQVQTVRSLDFSSVLAVELDANIQVDGIIRRVTLNAGGVFNLEAMWSPVIAAGSNITSNFNVNVNGNIVDIVKMNSTTNVNCNVIAIYRPVADLNAKVNILSNNTPIENGIWTWGSNQNARTGQNTTVGNTLIPTRTLRTNNVVILSAGGEHGFVKILNETHLRSWGSNLNFRTGQSTSTGNTLVPSLSTITINHTDVSSGFPQTSFILGNDLRSVGLLGTTQRNAVAFIADGGWIQVSSGIEHILALKSDGTIWSAGLNSSGQLGLGNFEDTNTLTQIGTDNDWVYVNTGSTSFHSFAIKSNGTLWSWGLNDRGQLGRTTTTSTQRLVPTQVGTDTNWTKLAAGNRHSLGLKSNGTLWSWGWNDSGRIGRDGNSAVPTQVGTDSWTDISAGFEHSIGIKANGTLYTWGRNQFGQLGLNDTTNRLVPTQVGINTNWYTVSAGESWSSGIQRII
jgi:alpha-tubulin suppressor-like RCC1 family protein